jgi:hypothetical protein
MMHKAFMIAGALALSGIAAAAMSGVRNEPVPDQVVPKTARATAFDNRWDNGGQSTVLKKQDRSPLPASPPALIGRPAMVAAVATEEIVPTAPPPVAEKIRLQVKADLKQKVTESGEQKSTCIKHKMRTVWHGRSWRCRK